MALCSFSQWLWPTLVWAKVSTSCHCLSAGVPNTVLHDSSSQYMDVSAEVNRQQFTRETLPISSSIHDDLPIRRKLCFSYSNCRLGENYLNMHLAFFSWNSPEATRAHQHPFCCSINLLLQLWWWNSSRPCSNDMASRRVSQVRSICKGLSKHHRWKLNL